MKPKYMIVGFVLVLMDLDPTIPGVARVCFTILSPILHVHTRVGSYSSFKKQC